MSERELHEPTHARDRPARDREPRSGEPRGDGERARTLDRTSEAQGRYVAPDRVELIADGVGRTAKARVPIAARVPAGQGPSIHTRATPEVFRVISAPNILPSIDEIQPNRHVVVGFAAAQPGKFEGTLVLSPLHPGFERLHVPLVGYTDPSLAPPKVPTRREVSLPAEVDLGEHVVGSDRLYDLASLRLDEPVEAVALPFTVLDPGASRSKVADPPLSLQETAADAFRGTTSEGVRLSHEWKSMLDISFAPKRPGVYRVLVEIPIRWADRVTTKHYVWVTGRAKPLTKGDDQFGAVGTRTSGAPPVDVELTGEAEHDFDYLAEKAGNEAASIIEEQRFGVGVAENNARGYAATPPEPSLLVKFIELALTMANSGIARSFSGVIARGLLPDAARTLGDSTAAQALKDMAKAEIATVSEPIREGLKTLGKQGIAAIKTGLSPTPERKPEAGGEPAPRNFGFFAAQHSDLNERAHDRRQLMTDTKFRLKRLLKTQPEVALLAQRTTLDALAAARVEAAHQQQMASTSNYVAAVAAGASTDAKALEKRLAHAREYGANSEHDYRRGMLRIEVRMDDHALAVRSAKLTGISSVLVADLQAVPLETLPVPIIVTASSYAGRGIATRDHRGVIRASGRWPIRESAVDEANKVEAARELLQRLLSKPLGAWGATIEHDDAGTHTEQAP